MGSDADLVVPHNIDAEKQVLGGIIEGDKNTLAALWKFDESDFWPDAHRLIFRACKAAFAETQSCALPIVGMHLRRIANPAPHESDETTALDWAGGAQYLTAIMRDAGGIQSFRRSVEEVRDLGDIRRMLRAMDKARSALMQPTVNPRTAIPDATAMIQQSLVTRSKVDDLRDMNEVMPSHEEWHDRLLNSPDDIRGARFGIPHLDKALGGLSDHLLVVLKGLPKFGKSSLALQAACRSARDFATAGGGTHVLVFALEDMKDQFIRRLVGHMGNIPNTMLKRGAYHRDGREKLKDRITVARGRVSVLPLIVDGSTRDVDEICARATVAAMKWPIGLVVVDYAQLLQGGRGRTEQELIGYQVGKLEWLAQQLSCPIILTSQTTVKEDGSLAAKNSAQYDEKATVSMTVWRGPLKMSEMSMDARRRSDAVHVLCTHNRRDAAFDAKRCLVDYSTDRWGEHVEDTEGGEQDERAA